MNTFEQKAKEAMGLTDLPTGLQAGKKSILGIAEPQQGFFKDYCDYAAKLTDAPPHYHLFVALSLVSTILTNKVYIPFGAQKLFPNLWTILMAPSSTYRKSTTIGIGTDVLSRANEELILPEEFTPEAFLTGLAQKPHGLLVWNEFGSILSSFERSYMLGMRETLTNLYDSPSSYKRKLKDTEYVIKDPCLSILAATTIDWFIEKCKEGDIRGGFLARFFYVPSAKKTKREGIPPKADDLKRNNLVKELNALSQIEGEVNTEYIKPKYDEWLFALEDQLEQKPEIETLSGFWTRLGIYALKFMMIYNIAEEKSLTISEPSFFKAIELVEILKNNVEKLVKEHWIFGQDAKDKAKLLKMIKSRPGITRRKLLQNSHMIARRLNPIIDTLIEEHSIEKEGDRFYSTNEDYL